MDHPDDPATLPAALDRILAQLKRLGAPVVDQLQPGLPDGEIVAAFRDLPFVPPRELRALYAWRNGTASEEDFFPGYVFLALEDAVADYREWCLVAKGVAEVNASNAAQIWNECWFPIFRPIYVTRYVAHCLDHITDTAPIRDVDVEVSADDVAYTSLTHMMRVFADCYETGAFTMHADGYLEEDEAQVGDIRRNYTPTRAEHALEALRQGVAGEALTQAIHDVLDMHDLRAIEPLLALLREGDADTRRAVILPLGLVGDERVMAPLLAIIAAGRAMPEAVRGTSFAYAWHVMNRASRMDSIAREQAIDAVESIAERTGQPLPLDPFLAAMRDPEPMVRLRAARRLGASGDTRALPALIAALGSFDQAECYTVIQALGQLGDPGGLEPLRQFAALPDGDSRANLRQAAREAIARIAAAPSGQSGG